MPRKKKRPASRAQRARSSVKQPVAPLPKPKRKARVRVSAAEKLVKTLDKEGRELLEETSKDLIRSGRDFFEGLQDLSAGLTSGAASPGKRGGGRGKRRNYSTEYARRVRDAVARGLSRSQARGHPKVGETYVSRRRPRAGRRAAPISDADIKRIISDLPKDAGYARKKASPYKSLSQIAGERSVSPERLRRILRERGLIVTERGSNIVNPDLVRTVAVMTRSETKLLNVNYAESVKAAKFHSTATTLFEEGRLDEIDQFLGQGVTDIYGDFHPFEIDPEEVARMLSYRDRSFSAIYKINLEIAS